MDEKTRKWLEVLSNSKQEYLCCYTCADCKDPLNVDPLASEIDD
jgi:hypothetical protein